jgi:hypothetical protein
VSVEAFGHISNPRSSISGVSKKETLKSKGLGAEARRKLHDDERYSKMIKEGGAWWRDVQEWIAERDQISASELLFDALRQADDPSEIVKVC